MGAFGLVSDMRIPYMDYDIDTMLYCSMHCCGGNK